MKGYSFGELVKLAESMAPLSGAVFTGNVTAPKFLISTAQPSEANAATRRDWVVAELAKKLDLAGGTVTGTTTMAKVLMSVNQPSEANSLTRKDYVDTKVARYEYGVGATQGTAPLASDYTEDKSRDFNTLLTAGEYTVDGNWANGVNNKAEPEGHMGSVKVEVRRFPGGGAYIQTFKAAAQNSYLAKTRVGSGTYPNIAWQPWVSFGPREAWAEYRMGISRPGSDVLPYFTIHKRDLREGLAPTASVITGEIQFKYGPSTDPNNPALAPITNSFQSQVRGDGTCSSMYLDARAPNDNSVLSVMRVGCINWATGATGWSLTNASKTTQISAGVLTTDKVLLSAAQGTESNAAVRRDYLINQLGNYLPLSGGRITGNLNISVGYLQLERPELPAIEFHAPGKHAHLVYLNVENGALEFSPSNGSGVGTTKAFTITTAEVTSQGRVASNANINRAWTEVGRSSFYSTAQLVGSGSLVSLVSGVAEYSGAHSLEHCYGSMSDPDLDKCCHVLWSTDGLSYTKAWKFHNNGKILTPSGTYLSADGNIVGSAWGGGSLSAWVTNNFSPMAHGVGYPGSYALMRLTALPDANPGDLRNGSELLFAAASGQTAHVGTGTWRCMGCARPGSGHPYDHTTLWHRIA